MRPDCFPLEKTSSYHATTPSLIEPPIYHTCLSTIEQLPIELLAGIASCCTFSAFLCLFSVSGHMRFKCLHLASNRDYLASAWIRMSAPWYEVHVPEMKHVSQNRMGSEGMGWEFLMRCIDSGSMMNRKRIWGIAQQLERKADEMGL